MTDHKAEWVLVPREATEAMVTAARGFSVPGYCVAAEQWPTIYAAMLAASPAPDEFQAAADDLVIYGIAIMRDGKRIDPRTVQIAPAASEATINSDGIDSRLIGAASEGEDGAVAWTRRKPARSGAYGVRGFELGVPAIEQFEAIVAVRLHDGELMCNLHKSTSESDVEEWTPVADLSDKFEWCEFVPARPAAQVADTPKHDEGREALVDRLHAIHNSWLAEDSSEGFIEYLARALATQPAARRVTDDPRVAELIEAAQRALDKAWEYGEDEPHFARLNDALESFAQPAEGVSGSLR